MLTGPAGPAGATGAAGADGMDGADGTGGTFTAQDEGTTLGTNVDTINIVGAGWLPLSWVRS